MKSKLIALALFVFTAATVVAYPQFQQRFSNTPPLPIEPLVQTSTQKPKIEVVFALDTTGSMGGLIQAAKEKIWSIASSMASAQSAPEIRVGLVAYRDRGDAYVTRVVDLSSDLDSMYAKLMDFQAAGGGDGPESVNQALNDAIHKISWSEKGSQNGNQEDNTYRVIFLVGDAPPHMDYPGEVKYPRSIQIAKRKGIVVNAIQCGNNGYTTKKWQQIAQLGHGRFFQVEQAGNAVAVATPFDKKLAELSKKMDDTRLYYGNAKEKAQKQAKVKATDKLHARSSVESRARRATFNASKSGKENMFGKGDLVDDIESGRVDLSEVETEKLPAAMQAMSPAEQKAVIEETAKRRNEVQEQILGLSQQRKDYIRKKVKEEGGAKDSLDEKIYSAVREQAAGVGLEYEADAVAY